MKKKYDDDEFLRKRAERQKKIKKRRLKIFFCLLLLITILVGAILSVTVFFPIEKLTFKGSEIYTESEIAEVSGIKKGDNLFVVSKTKVAKNLKSKLPYIETVEFKRTLPDTLEVKVKDAEEFACYSLKEKYFIVSQSGWVLKNVAEIPQNIPTIIGMKAECKVGRQIEFQSDELKILSDELSKSLTDADIKINLIDVTDEVAIKLSVEDRFEVNLGTSNFLKEKIRHLEAMIEKIPENQGGNINLSMWTNENSQGTFTKK